MSVPFTTSPWSIKRRLDGTFSVVSDSAKEPVCDIVDWSHDQNLADARLIAAAPAMFEALTAAPKISDYNGDFSKFEADYLKWWEARSYALAKAGSAS
jgi:hypothetical protein